MRVAFLVDAFPVISETFILDQITGMIDLGVDVHIIARSRPPSDAPLHPAVSKYRLVEKTTYIDFPQSRFKRICHFLWRVIPHLFKNAKLTLASLNVVKFKAKALSLYLFYHIEPFLTHTFDILHAHFGLNGVWATHLRQCGVSGKILTSFHGIDMYTHVREHGDRVYNDLFQTGELCSANSDYSLHRVIELGCPASKLFVLPESLRLEKFPFSPKSLPRPDAPVKFLTVARLVEKKGHIYALRAFQKLYAYSPQWHYTLLGDGPLRQELETFVQSAGLNEHVSFLGSQPRDTVIHYLEASHIFLLPSVTARNGDKEGQALVNQEAQAMGLPVISTVHNGIPEGVVDGKSGFLVPERDVDALYEKLVWCVEHPDRWSAFGKAGRAFVAQKYDTPLICRQLLTHYERLVNGL